MGRRKRGAAGGGEAETAFSEEQIEREGEMMQNQLALVGREILGVSGACLLK